MFSRVMLQRIQPVDTTEFSLKNSLNGAESPDVKSKKPKGGEIISPERNPFIHNQREENTINELQLEPYRGLETANPLSRKPDCSTL